MEFCHHFLNLFQVFYLLILPDLIFWEYFLWRYITYIIIYLPFIQGACVFQETNRSKLQIIHGESRKMRQDIVNIHNIRKVSGYEHLLMQRLPHNHGLLHHARVNLYRIFRCYELSRMLCNRLHDVWSAFAFSYTMCFKIICVIWTYYILSI